MDNQDKYRLFCRQQTHLPVFAQDWYLDAVCAGGRWSAVLVEEAGRVAAVLPYFIKRKGPFRYITMPVLCKFMGPYFPADLTDDYKQQKLMKILVAGLPDVDYFYQQFYYDCTNWLPFYWAGFQQQTRYSYLLDNIQDLEATHTVLHADYRNHKLRKASAQLVLSTEGTLAEFLTLVGKSYARQHLALPFSSSYFQNLYEVLQQQAAGQLFFARDEKGLAYSAACLIWDERAAYLLLAGDDPEYRSSGSGIFLTWELIRFASQVLRLPRFDFLGSMIEPIERVRRQFGARQQPYLCVWQQPSLLFGLIRRLK